MCRDVHIHQCIHGLSICEHTQLQTYRHYACGHVHRCAHFECCMGSTEALFSKVMIQPREKAEVCRLVYADSTAHASSRCASLGCWIMTEHACCHVHASATHGMLHAPPSTMFRLLEAHYLMCWQYALVHHIAHEVSACHLAHHLAHCSAQHSECRSVNQSTVRHTTQHTVWHTVRNTVQHTTQHTTQCMAGVGMQWHASLHTSM